MEERGIPDGCHDGLVQLILSKRMKESRCQCDCSAHIQAGIHCAQIEPQGIAANVRGENGFGFHFSYGEKCGPVRASRTEGGSPNRQLKTLHQFHGLLIFNWSEGLKIQLFQNLAYHPMHDPGSQFPFSGHMA